VALIDPAPLGGLTGLGTTNMIGPGWIYSAASLRPHLTKDIERFRIPHLTQRAVHVAASGGRFAVRLGDGGVVSARTVILCPGMRLLSGEAPYWKRGISATSLGVEPTVQKIVGWLGDPRHRHIVFVGSAKLANLFRVIAEHRKPQHRITFVIEPNLGYRAPGPEAATPAPGDVVHGTIVRLGGEGRLRDIAVATEGGELHPVTDIDLLAIDFLSYETTPARSVFCEDLALDPDGFVAVDRRQQTNIPGLFAAGDATGMPAAVAPAVAEGVVAGFEAYRYVYQQKFAAEPPLFAYYGVDRELSSDESELPAFSPAEFGPEILSDPDHTLQLATRRFWGDERRVAVELVELVRQSKAVMSIAAIAHHIAADIAVVQRILDRLLRFKQITLQPID
jgi:hypothetical protein